MALMDELRQVMKRDGRTRYALAKAADISASNLHRMVHEGTGLNIDAIERLADVLGFDVRLVPKGKISSAGTQDAPQVHGETASHGTGTRKTTTRQTGVKRQRKGGK